MSPETIEAQQRLILPLDVDNEEAARKIIDRLANHIGVFKVGYELGFGIGWQRAAALVKESGAKLFIDAKLDDIANTVGAGARALSRLEPDMLTVHASAGAESVLAAKAGCPSATILAVTVLTHLSDDSCKAIFGATAAEKVPELALEAVAGGAHGIVCSAKELAALGRLPELDALVRVTPGVRPEWAAANDQKRTTTPADAILAGADYLVIGRPILEPPDSIGDSEAAATIIASDIAKAVAAR